MPRWASNAFTWLCRPQRALVLLLLGLAGYRLSLIGTGHFFWVDEWCYKCVFPFIDHLCAGEYFYGVIQLFTPTARPGLVLCAVVPALLQRGVGAVLGISPESLHYYDAVSAFNVLVTLGITICVYGLAKTWLTSPGYALVTALVHALLCNSNFYIRHMVPYYSSLLMLLAALWVVSTSSARQEPRHPRMFSAVLSLVVIRAMAAGWLGGLALGSYPGYHLFLGVLGVAVLVGSRRRGWATVGFVFAVGTVLLGFEVLARSVGVSYFGQVLRSQERGRQWVSAPWNEGIADEGFVFAWRYLSEVEGVIGSVLFVLFVAYLVLVLPRRGARVAFLTRVTFATVVSAYLFQAAMGVFLQRSVFFGRFLTMYLPFVVCGAVQAVQHIPFPRLRRGAVAVLLVISAGSFASFAREYAGITYPADLFQTVMAEKGVTVLLPRDLAGLGADWAMVIDGRPEGMVSTYRGETTVHLASYPQARTCGARFIAVNFKDLHYSPERYQRFQPSEGYRLEACAEHPTAFPATNFEGFPPQARQRLLERRHRMRLYERVAGQETFSAYVGR